MYFWLILTNVSGLVGAFFFNLFELFFLEIGLGDLFLLDLGVLQAFTLICRVRRVPYR